MESCEAVRDEVHGKTIINNNTYGITLNIGPYKLIDGKKWNRYTEIEQKQELLNILYEKLRDYTDVDEIGAEQVIFEKTKKGNVHIHAILHEGQVTKQMLEKIQQSIHSQYGYKKDEINKVFDFSKTIIHKKFWLQYMAKDQPNKPIDRDHIPLLNMVIQYL